MKNKNKFTVVGELVCRYNSVSSCFDYTVVVVVVVGVDSLGYFIYLTHFRTAVIAGSGTQRLVDMNLFCFDTSLRNSLRFFSAARLRYQKKRV